MRLSKPKKHIGSITLTRNTPKSGKYPPTKKLLHKSPIRPPKTIKDIQKTCLKK